MDKICKKCSLQKQGSEFYNNSTKSDRLSTWCISCSKEYVKQNPAKAKIRRIQNLRYSKSKKGRLANKKAKVRRRQNPLNRLEDYIRTYIWRVLRSRKNNKTFVMLGYTPEQLKKHLEKQFTKGMTWDNYGKWHIDHIIPVSFFEYVSPDDVEFTNLVFIESLR